MAALSLGFDELERRLELVRRRLNLYALQDAFYRTAGVILGGAAAVVAADSSADGRFSGPARWVFVALAVAATAHSALRLRRQWLSLDEAAELADHEARLDCRLATMLAQRRSPVRSRLRALLLAEVFSLASRWTPERLAPRRVPRSVAGFGAALLLFAAAILLAPPPQKEHNAAAPAGSEQFAARPQRATRSSSAADGSGPAQQPGTAAEEGQPGRAGAPADGAHSALPASERAGGGSQGEGRSGSDSAKPATNGTAAGVERAGRGSGRNAETEPAPKDSPTGPRGVGERAGEDTPAQETGAKDVAQRRGVATPSTEAREQQRGRMPEQSKSESRRGADVDRAAQPHGEAARNAERQQVAQPRDAGAKGAKGAERGGRDGDAEKSGLYGAAGKNSAPAADAAAMLIKLTAFSAVAPQGSERQGKEATTDRGGADDTAGEAEPSLAEQSEREMPLVRVPLAVEYEAMLRDIFTPQP